MDPADTVRTISVYGDPTVPIGFYLDDEFSGPDGLLKLLFTDRDFCQVSIRTGLPQFFVFQLVMPGKYSPVIGRIIGSVVVSAVCPLTVMVTDEGNNVSSVIGMRSDFRLAMPLRPA